MTEPRRIQLRRTRGWRMPPNTVKADRSTRLGNPWRVGEPFVPNAAEAVHMFQVRLPGGFLYQARPPYPESHMGQIVARLPELRGKNLACWCRLCERHADGKPFGEHCPDCEPCHVDPLGEIANRSIR